MQPSLLSASGIVEAVKRKETSAEEAAKEFIKNIKRIDPQIRAFITLREREALEEARAIDAKLKSGEDTDPLCGLPIAIKDNICTVGTRTTCASRILENFIPPYDATVVKALKASGAIVIGKTNMDEFAMGSSCENSAFFSTANPWNMQHVPGGSSGGSAAAVAALEVPVALGSDTGGSVRQPAAFCGVIGLKPTYGRISRYGLIAYASSLDQIGPISRNVRDCALLMNVISGRDPLDSTSADVEVSDYLSFLGPDLKGIRVGVPREYMVSKGMDLGVVTAVRVAIEVLESLGASVDECSLPHTEEALAAYYLIAPAEASSNLARYDGVRYGFRADTNGDLLTMYQTTRRLGFGNEVKRRIMLGTYALSAGYYDAYYLRALKVRTLVKHDFDEAFGKFDILVGPTSPTVAFKMGEMVKDPVQMYLQDVFTIPVNMAGIPAMSIPCGLHAGLPVGLQILGKPFDEGTLLRAAYAYEEATGFRYVPPLVKEGEIA